MMIEPPPVWRISGRQCFTDRNTPSRLIAVCRRQSSSDICDDRRHRDSDAGIGNQDVEPAVAFSDFGHHFHPARLAGHILMQEHRLVAGLLDAGDNFRALEIIDIGDDDRGAFARQQLGDRRTNAG